MSLQILVVLILCAGACLGKNNKKCENIQYLKDVRIPQGQLFKKTDFNNFVTGNFLKQAYILLPDPAPFTVSTNYNCKIEAVGASNYERVCTGLEPICTEFSLALTTDTQGNKISFSYTNPNDVKIYEYYWSSCPSKYILRLQCSEGELQPNNKCTTDGAQITVFLIGDVNLNNAPWNDISKEIFTSTGVKFGDIDGMSWYFTESTDTPCVV